MSRTVAPWLCVVIASSCGKVTEDLRDGDAAPAILDDAGQPIDCRFDRDCGLPVPDEFGPCDYEDACDEQAEQSRMVVTPRCDNDICVARMIPETRTCSRDQEGAVCEDDGMLCGSPVACHTCQSGACALNTNAYDASCNPDCQESGRLCGSGIAVCCSDQGPEFSCNGNGDSTFECADCCYEICDFDLGKIP